MIYKDQVLILSKDDNMRFTFSGIFILSTIPKIKCCKNIHTGNNDFEYAICTSYNIQVRVVRDLYARVQECNEKH